MGSAVLALPEGAGSRRCETCGERFPGDFRVCPRDGTALHDGQPPADPLLGTVLAGTYRLVRALGRGGMGQLYEAEHLRLSRRFAVKVLAEAHADRPEQVRRFEREARALAPLGSPHVVDVVDVLRCADGRPCLVTPLLTGEDLGRRLAREGRLPPDEAVAIARQMCRGLCAAHAHGVIHRDLKPSNVFLVGSPDGGTTVKLLDFGVAKLLGAEDLTRTGAVVGTPSYMAPEQARGAARVAEAADVYGVGAVLYHLLAGQAPYPPDGDEPTSVLARVLSREPPRLRRVAPDVPEALEVVVQAAMAREPAERVQSARELEALLAEVDVPVAEPPPAAGPRVPGGLAAGRAPDTRVLPEGTASPTGRLAHQAARARPRTLLLAFATCLGAAIAAAACTAAGLALTGLSVTQGVGLWLVRLAALASAAGMGVPLARRLRPRWPSTVAVETVRRRLARGLLVGASGLGAALGLVAGLRAFDGDPSPLALGTVAPALALAATAGLAAAIVGPRPVS